MEVPRLAWLGRLAAHRRPAQVQAFSGTTRINASWCIPPRRLDDHLIWLVLRGGCHGAIDGTATVLGPGDLMWLQPGVPHRFERSPGPAMMVMHLRLGPDLPAGQVRSLVVSEAWPARVLIEDLIAETRRGLAGSDGDGGLDAAKLRAGFASLAILIWRLADDAAQRSGLPPARLDRLIRFVRADPRRRRSLAACAAHLGLSQVYLSRCAALSLGRPFRTWQLAERMRTAALRLGESRLPVAAVASEFGYLDAHVFSRQFSQVMGVGPRAYRTAVGAIDG